MNLRGKASGLLERTSPEEIAYRHFIMRSSLYCACRTFYLTHVLLTTLLALWTHIAMETILQIFIKSAMVCMAAYATDCRALASVSVSEGLSV